MATLRPFSERFEFEIFGKVELYRFTRVCGISEMLEMSCVLSFCPGVDTAQFVDE